MLESVKHIVQTVIVPLISIAMIFFALIWMQNGNTMLLSIEMTKGTRIVPKLYFAKRGEDCSEQNTVSGQEIRKHLYALSLPSFESIHRVLLKPTQKKGDVLIRNINVIQTNWFTKTRYALPLNHFSPFHQLDNFKQDKKKISFQATGVDTLLDVRFPLEAVSSSQDKHIELLFIAILLYLIMYYLYWLYKTEELNTFFISKLILYSLFFALAMFKVDYYKDNIRFGYPPDESVHLKYIKYVHDHHSVVPEFEKMPHYLSHPPLYYELMNLVYDEHAPSKENIDNIRTLSMIIFIGAFMLILYLGFSSYMGVLGHFVYLSVISSIPMPAYLGGSITNDTLAMLGAIVFILGMKRLIEERYDASTYLIIGIGAFIAYFSKLTAALLIFFAVLFFLIRMLFTKRWIKLNKTHIILLILIFVPILYYQLSIIFHYHALVPTYDHTHLEQYLKSGFFIPEQFRQHLSSYQWLERMIHHIHGGWFGIYSHHGFGHEKWVGFIGLLVAHVFALLALFLPCKEENRTFCLIGKITLLALLSVLTIQYFFSFKTHLSSGYMGGLQPRYLLPFMFAFAIMAATFVERFHKIFIVTILIIVICIQAIYSDFFYFLQYYQ